MRRENAPVFVWTAMRVSSCSALTVSGRDSRRRLVSSLDVTDR
jgi:hypothetical protein